MQSETKKLIGLSGKGWWVNDYGVVYVRGTVDGKSYKKSTKEKATKIYINYIKKNHRDVLLQLIDKNKPKKMSTKFIDFGKDIIDLTSKDRNLNSQKAINYTFEKHLKTYFEHYDIEDIKPLDIEKWQNKLLENLSTASAKKVRDLLNIIMKKAHGNDLIAKNPCEFADKIKVNSKKTKPYTELEMKLMLEHSDGWLHLFLLLAFSTGLRTGELMALKWEDINFENGYIDLKRSISKGVITEADEYKSKIKNHERLIELTQVAVKTLSSYKINTNTNSNWIFTSQTGEPFKESATIIKYHFKPLLFKLGIEYRTIYATRHTFISMMLNNGFDKSWVKDMVGHSQSSNITEDVYFTFEKDDKRIESVNNMFVFPKEEKII